MKRNIIYTKSQLSMAMGFFGEFRFSGNNYIAEAIFI
jgi:hypothetical protein